MLFRSGRCFRAPDAIMERERGGESHGGAQPTEVARRFPCLVAGGKKVCLQKKERQQLCLRGTESEKKEREERVRDAITTPSLKGKDLVE